ncbi:MAG: hypothetical protein IPI06_07925 [Gammaproteobacteria bacterium]|nr:hypothetical protein [Gammaproteobacteria bacterium]
MSATGDSSILPARSSCSARSPTTGRRGHDPTISIERVDAPATRPRPADVGLEQRLRELAAATSHTALFLVDHVE